MVHVQSDLSAPDARRALQGVDVLYHLGAQVWQGRGPGALARMYSVNVGGTRNVLAAKPGAVVFASSASVYGAWPDNPVPMDERHPVRPNPECPYAQHKLLAERACLEDGNVGRRVVVRLAAVLGPHADARVARSLQGYRLAVPAVRGARQAVQWLDEDDALAGLLAAGRALTGAGLGGGGGPGGGRPAGDVDGHERPASDVDGHEGPAADVDGQVINLAPTDWLGAHDMARAAGSRVVSVPRPVLMGLSELGRALGLAPFGADRAALVSGPLALSPARARQLLGWAPQRTSAQVFEAALNRGRGSWRSHPRNR